MNDLEKINILKHSYDNTNTKHLSDKIKQKLKQIAKRTKDNVIHNKEACEQVIFEDEFTYVNIVSISRTLKQFKRSLDLHNFDDEFVNITIPIRKTKINNISNVNINNNVYILREKLNTNYLEDDIDTEWITSMNTYIKSLSKEELFTVYGYTYNGDVFINHYMRNSLDINKFYISLKNNYNTDKIFFPLFFQTLNFMCRIDILKYFKTDSETIDFLKTNPEIVDNHIKTIQSSQNLSVKYDSVRKLMYYMDYNIFWKQVLDDYKNALQNIIKNAPETKKPMYLYRGVESDYIVKDFKKHRNRNIIFNSSFISTSSILQNAYRFTNFINCCLMRILVPVGFRCLYISGMSYYDDDESESEFLLGYDTIMKVNKARYQTLCQGYTMGKGNVFDMKKYKAHKMYVTDCEIILNDSETVKSSHTSFDEIISKLINFYKDNFQIDTFFKHYISGGYALNILLQTKYNTHKQMILDTNDIDIYISIKDTTINQTQCLKLVVDNLTLFLNEINIQNEILTLEISSYNNDLQMKIGKEIYNIFHILIIKYNGKPFTHITITNMDITDNMIDKELTNKMKIPFKKMEYYLLEYLRMIYAGSLPDVYPFIYKQRSLKKDIQTSKTLCHNNTFDRYTNYCKALLNIDNIDTFIKMSQQDKNEYILKYLPILDTEL